MHYKVWSTSLLLLWLDQFLPTTPREIRNKYLYDRLRKGWFSFENISISQILKTYLTLWICNMYQSTQKFMFYTQQNALISLHYIGLLTPQGLKVGDPSGSLCLLICSTVALISMEGFTLYVHLLWVQLELWDVCFPLKIKSLSFFLNRCLLQNKDKNSSWKNI